MEQLHMNLLRDLIFRLRAGESERRIARDLDLSRITVHKYHLLAEQQGYLRPDLVLAGETALGEVLGPAPQPPQQISGLEPFADTVRQLREQGCEMTAIWARLRDDYGYKGSYSSVRRYIHQVDPPAPHVTVRVFTAPGEEAQVDFGSVGRLYDPRQQRPRVAYAFVATLSYSRHQYAELVFDQKVETWIGLHRRAFENWGGIPQRIVPDNLKAAVQQVLWYDPILGEAYRRMAQHYGFLVSPTRPATPQHKGKVENGIHYLQRNFMAGRQFTDIDLANRLLSQWVREEAGTRNHGTTHQAPWLRFCEQERAALLPLPVDPFDLVSVRPVKVHPDCHVVIEGSFYSVPYAYVGRTLEAYLHERVIELYQGQTLLATHVRTHAKGEHVTQLSHYPLELSAFLLRTPTRCRELAAEVGPATQEVVRTLLDERPLDHLRSVQGLLHLEERVGRTRLEAACKRALFFGDVHYRQIKQILNAALDREPLPGDLPGETAVAHTFARPSAEFFGSPTPSPEEVQAC